MSDRTQNWQPGPAWLFCPANRPDRYEKAQALADVVILDLEDAVAPNAKGAAREAVRRAGHEGRLDPERTVLRVNRSDCADHSADLQLAADLRLPRLMLAKAENPQQIAAIPHEVVALLESPRGIELAGDIARVSNVVAVMWGADDLVAGMGGLRSRHPDGTFRDVARFARSRALVAAKAYGRLALDAVHMDIPDRDGLAVQCEDAVAVGFDATVAIHPSQVAVIRAAYTPSVERVDWARRLLEFVGADRGVTTFEGQMVDGPIFTQAERTLRRATAAGSTMSRQS